MWVRRMDIKLKEIDRDAREVLVTIQRTGNGKSRYLIDKAKCIHDIYTDRTVWESYEYGVIGISNAKYEEVTAWMELPVPYKESD